ncbi:MAG: hypothetical protein B0D85_03480, partial [Candidatus Sedimenticola endophacoides]
RKMAEAARINADLGARIIDINMGCPAKKVCRVAAILHEHLQHLHAFHGARHGVRVARKHIAWYSRRYPGGATFRKAINQTDCARRQLEIVKDFFQQLTERELAA